MAAPRGSARTSTVKDRKPGRTTAPGGKGPGAGLPTGERVPPPPPGEPPGAPGDGPAVGGPPVGGPDALRPRRRALELPSPVTRKEKAVAETLKAMEAVEARRSDRKKLEETIAEQGLSIEVARLRDRL